MARFQVKMNYYRVAPRKVRLVADLVRGRPVQEALDLLTFSPAASARDMAKLIRSAVANADRTGGVDLDLLKVKLIWVDQGPTLRRSLPRARGTASRINKKTSHVTVVLEDQ